MRSLRRKAPASTVATGERVLASCASVDGELIAGTRDALHLGSLRVPWEEVRTADGDRETDLFKVVLVGSWGEEQVSRSFSLPKPGRLLELVRERVTASVVLQRRVPLSGGLGVQVIGRRPPRGTGEIEWFFEYDEGVDPADPVVREAARSALAAARGDVGL